MEDLLYVRTTQKPQNQTDDEWPSTSMWVDDNVLNHISGETHARTLYYGLSLRTGIPYSPAWQSSLLASRSCE